MQGTSKQAPIQLGRLTAEDAERFAAMFRPAWELDDAPFASGTKLSAADMDALAAPGGIDVEVANAAAVAPHFPPKAQPPAAAIDSIEIQLDPTSPPAPKPAPVAAKPPLPAAVRAQQQQQQQQRQAPRPVAMAADEDFAPPKKSNVGIFVGIGLVALLGIGVAAKFALGGGDKTTATTTAQTATHEEPRIPPPPAAVDTTPSDPTPVETGKATPPVATTPPPVATTPPPVATTPPPPAATHAPVAAIATAAAPKPAGTTKPAPNATTKPNKSGIVRDNPF